MWDERSFDSQSFSSTSWWLDAAQIIVRAVHSIAREVRSFAVAVELRTATIAFELRTLTNKGEKRTHELEHEARAFRINPVPIQSVVAPSGVERPDPEIRYFEVSAEGRGLKIAGEIRGLSIPLETRLLYIPAQL